MTGSRAVLRFFVPGRPAAWARAGSRIVQRRGTTGTCAKDYAAVKYTKTRMRAEQQRIWALCHRAMQDECFERCVGPVALFVLAVFKLPDSLSGPQRARRVFHDQKPDDDNIRKNVADALKGEAWSDDCQVAFGPPMKVWSATTEGIEVWVAPIDQGIGTAVAAFTCLGGLAADFLVRAGVVALEGRLDAKDGTLSLAARGERP